LSKSDDESGGGGDAATTINSNDEDFVAFKEAEEEKKLKRSLAYRPGPASNTAAAAKEGRRNPGDYLSMSLTSL
jgi:hypothetical protein